MKKIFLSYSRTDIKKAEKLYTELHNLPGISVWFDQEDLLPGTSWRPAIRKAIRESDCFIALLSKNSVLSTGFRHSELKQALEVKNEFPEDQIFLIPVRLDDCEMPFEALKEITYTDLFPVWGRGLEKIIKAIGVKRSYTNTPDHKKSVLDYEYRIGLADLDIGLTNLQRLAEELNQTQSYFHFTLSELHAPPDAIGEFENSMNLCLYRLPKTFYKQSAHVNFDRVICLTRYFLAYQKNDDTYCNFLARTSQYDERFMFISTGGLHNHAQKAGVKYEIAIVFLMVSKLADYFMNIDYHQETRECPMDFTEEHSELVSGLQKGTFCEECNSILQQNPQIHRALVNMLKWGRH